MFLPNGGQGRFTNVVCCLNHKKRSKPMNGLKYLVLAGVLLAIPAFALTQSKHAAMMEESMPATMPDCKLVSPVLVPGEVYTTVEESCPPSSFDICKTIRARQHFCIEGGCRKECMKCDAYGKCEVVPCHEMCCKPVCKERCCKPRCHKERCCPRPRCCR